MKLYIVAGEASGDLHGSNLIRSLRRLQPGIQCRVWGGDLMQEAGGVLVKHYRDLAFMGFWEVLKNLRTIFNNLAFCKKDILDYQPDALILIDYPGFNLRIAKWARREGLKVIYYISPQIWAWHTSRVHDIRRDVDKMLVILPFEEEFYKKYGVEAEFVGHPLLDAIHRTPYIEHRTPNAERQISNAEIIALLPGSRRQEVQRILPVMLEATENFPEYQFVVAGATSLPESFYRNIMAKYPDVELRQGQTYDLLRQAVAALVKSGTSTLETALFDVPQVVCYAGNPLSYHIARRLVKVKYISLVNLILDKPVVVELIQNELNVNNLTAALRQTLEPDRSAEIHAGYELLRRKLGEGGASERAAKAMLSVIK